MQLFEHLATLGLKGASARKALKTGKVQLMGVPVSDGGREVDPADITYRADARRVVPGRDPILIHRDEDLVVLWKPSGLLSVPARKEGGHLNVQGFVRRITGAALPVHRLDQDTSGLMMVAQTKGAQGALKAQLEVHSVERRYLAIVCGRPRESAWTEHNWLVRNRGDGRRGTREDAEAEEGRLAVSHFRVCERLGKKASLVEATLETGRTHQVRIHLAECGHVVLGDRLYGSRNGHLGARRMSLHAAVLGFDHPRTGKVMRFVTELPDDMARLRRELLRAHTSHSGPRRRR